MKTPQTVILMLSLVLAACGPADAPNHGHDAAADTAQQYTCPMHPQVVRDAPGECPICGMALVVAAAQFRAAAEVVVTPALQQQLGIRTAEAVRGTLWRRIDTVGQVAWDATATRHYHTRTGGWIEGMAVHSVGDPVRAGELLFRVYAPEVIAAQEEYLGAMGAASERLMRAARARLDAMGMAPPDFATLERSRRPVRAIGYYATHDGVVSAIGAREGMYTSPSLEVLAVTATNSVWLSAAVTPRQAGWVITGHALEARFQELPGQTLAAEVNFIGAELDTTTRTLEVRATLANTEGLLRPGMFADVRILGGPKHEVVSVPVEAVIRTGDGDRVVIALAEGRFATRVVHTGLESGGLIEILHGLDAGDTVVVSGQFLLDSEARLRSGLERLEDHGEHR